MQIVMLIEADGSAPELLRLTQDQLRLLCWLEENEYFSTDLAIHILSDLNEPKKI